MQNLALTNSILGDLHTFEVFICYTLSFTRATYTWFSEYGGRFRFAMDSVSYISSLVNNLTKLLVSRNLGLQRALHNLETQLEKMIIHDGI